MLSGRCACPAEAVPLPRRAEDAENLAEVFVQRLQGLPELLVLHHLAEVVEATYYVVQSRLGLLPTLPDGGVIYFAVLAADLDPEKVVGMKPLVLEDDGLVDRAHPRDVKVLQHLPEEFVIGLTYIGSEVPLPVDVPGVEDIVPDGGGEVCPQLQPELPLLPELDYPLLGQDVPRIDDQTIEELDDHLVHARPLLPDQDLLHAPAEDLRRRLPGGPKAVETSEHIQQVAHLLHRPFGGPRP